MSYNGSGTFNINTAGQPVVSGTVISSSVFNSLTNDLANGLSTAICKDGQTTITANIPFNGYKITNLGAGTAVSDAARLDQIQSGSASLVTVSGTDTYTGSMSPALVAYAAGNVFSFVVPNTNTTSCTLNIDGLGAKAITRDGSTALVAGDLVAGSEVLVAYDGTRFQVLNSNSKTNFNVSSTLTANSAFLSNPLAVTSGGTGQNSYTNGQLLIGNSTGNTLTKSTLTAGSGVTITNGAGSITISATGSGGTVTSVTATSPVQSTGGTAPVISMPAANGTTNGYLSSTDWTTFNSKGSGTVTAVFVASANGLAGTSSGGATPALTLSTTVTGVLKGNGTAISAAVSGTDYAPATSGASILYGNGSGGFSNVTVGSGLSFSTGTLSATATGTVTSVGQTFTGGLISVSGSPVTTSGTLALTVAGTSGGVPYFSSASTWASSGVLAANALMIGGGAGIAPSTITTGTGVVTALGVNTGSAGAFVVNGGALGTPSSGTLTNATGLPLSTGVTGTLPVANGGTGQTTYTDGQLLIGNSTGNTLTKATLTAGSGISITNGGGSITIASTGGSGTVTSVSQTFTGGLISVSGSPITGSGTLALTVAGTSGGIPYFSTASTWASSAALTANAIMVGGGAGAAPSTITTGTGVVTALGVNTGTAGAFVVNGGALGTPSSGTLTNATGLPLSTGVTGTLPVGNGGTGITSGTSGGIPYFSGTTTIASSAALAANALVIGGGAGVAPSTTTTGSGVLTALGNAANATGGFATINGTATLTNKRIDPRVTSTTSATSLTPDISSADIYAYTALAANLTINAPTGTPVDGDKLMFRLLDNGTSRTLTWNATYTVIGVTLPTATTASKTTYVGCVYNANNTRWDVIAVTTQA